MKSLLTVAEAVAILTQKDPNGVPVPFSVVFVTANQARQTGGEVIRFSRAVLCRRGDDHHDATKPQAPARSASDGPQKPDWMYHLRNLDSGAIRQAHYHLIASLNDQSLR